MRHDRDRDTGRRFDPTALHLFLIGFSEAQWTGLGLAVSVVIGLVRLAIAAWYHSDALVSYLISPAFTTVIVGAFTGFAIAAIVRRWRQP